MTTDAKVTEKHSDLAMSILDPLRSSNLDWPVKNAIFCDVEQALANAERDGRKEWDERFSLPTRPPIVCLCGSTRFMEAFFEEGWRLTLEGQIVLSVGVCKHVDTAGGHGGEALGQDVADRLDELHMRKIDLADWVFVLNVSGYIGDSTRAEIEYARAHEKPVEFLEPEEKP